MDRQQPWVCQVSSGGVNTVVNAIVRVSGPEEVLVPHLNTPNLLLEPDGRACASVTGFVLPESTTAVAATTVATGTTAASGADTAATVTTTGKDKDLILDSRRELYCCVLTCASIIAPLTLIGSKKNIPQHLNNPFLPPCALRDKCTIRVGIKQPPYHDSDGDVQWHQAQLTNLLELKEARERLRSSLSGAARQAFESSFCTTVAVLKVRLRIDSASALSKYLHNYDVSSSATMVGLRCDGCFPPVGTPVRLCGVPYGVYAPQLFSHNASNGIVASVLTSSRHDEEEAADRCCSAGGREAALPLLAFIDARCLPGSEGGPVYAWCQALHSQTDLDSLWPRRTTSRKEGEEYKGDVDQRLIRAGESSRPGTCSDGSAGHWVLVGMALPPLTHPDGSAIQLVPIVPLMRLLAVARSAGCTLLPIDTVATQDLLSSSKDNTVKSHDIRSRNGCKSLQSGLLCHGDAHALAATAAAASLTLSPQVPVSTLSAAASYFGWRPKVPASAAESSASVVLLSSGRTWASGVIVCARRGLIVTCAHVVKAAQHNGVLVGGSSINKGREQTFCVLTHAPKRHWSAADVIYICESGFPDIAVLQLKCVVRNACPHHIAANNLHSTSSCSGSTQPYVDGRISGIDVLACGFPMFDPRAAQLGPTCTFGIAHAHHYAATSSGARDNVVNGGACDGIKGQPAVMLHASTVVYPGSSGGALFDARSGHLLGILVSFAQFGGSVSIEDDGAEILENRAGPHLISGDQLSHPRLAFALPVCLLQPLWDIIKPSDIVPGATASCSNRTTAHNGEESGPRPDVHHGTVHKHGVLLTVAEMEHLRDLEAPDLAKTWALAPPTSKASADTVMAIPLRCRL